MFNDVQYKKYEHLPRMLISYISSLAAFPHRVGLIISVLLFDQTYPFYLLF
ncbi:LIVCS family branched chain amino acid:cation symporter [Psychrobacter sp. 1501(2011)]|nr:LIVCS family branched chain amino acid:cation symporter [Psychrobacter sp. 1501(2011)]